MGSICKGSIKITLSVLNSILREQRAAPYARDRVLIVSVKTGRLILTTRNCSLLETSFIFPVVYFPRYDDDLKFLGLVSAEHGGEIEADVRDGFARESILIEDAVEDYYWDVGLVKDEKEVDAGSLKPVKKLAAQFFPSPHNLLDDIIANH